MLELQEEIFKEKFVCSDISLRDIEKISKESGNNQRRAKRLLELFERHYYDYEVYTWDTSMDTRKYHSNDMHVIECAYYYSQTHENTIYATAKICNANIAQKCFGLPTDMIHNTESIYRGYRTIEGSIRDINEQIGDCTNFYTNEYVIIKNTETDETSEMRFDGEKLVSLRLPPSKYIKAKNALQRCALDALYNPNITIVAILGTRGGGKSYLSMQMARYAVCEKPYQSHILGVREPIGEGTEIGWLKGDFDDKTDKFFLPMMQQLDGGEYELESLKQRGIVEAMIPYYMKGTTFNDTIIMVDEAEDLNEKLIKLIGTRVGTNSRIFWSGDYKQSSIDASSDNALVRMCNEFRGNPLFACVYLDDDVRSDTSKLFTTLYGHDI